MKVLLAVSGGIDSMYMAMHASELFKGASLAVAHCNFNLRGEESDGDERFVREWCESAELTYFVNHFDTSEYAKQKGLSIEMAARELRYGWFASLCREKGIDAVAVAHNANDNAETLLLNLLRGTGSRGMRGMSKESRLEDSEIRLLRPLLGVSREEIREWMLSNGADWREDSTNAQSEYKRNLLRNRVFPLLKQVNPSVVKTLNADMQRFAQVDEIAQDYYSEHIELVMDRSGAIKIGTLLELTHWKYMLWRLLEGSGIAAEEFESLLSCLESGRQLAGKRFGPVLGASGRLEIDKAEYPCKRELRYEIVESSEIKTLRQPAGVLIMDADKVALPLKVRAWREGDWMQPLGMRGRKKLSDMMTDLHWSRSQKAEAQVIELKESQVAALLFERIDDSVKVGVDTLRVLRIWEDYDR